MKTRRVRLLVSVRDPSEARAAVRGGADIIDIKEPKRGPLGRADYEVMAAIVAQCGGDAALISAALGEIADPLQEAPPGSIGYGKIGLAQAPGCWWTLLEQRFAQLGVAYPVAVAYADHMRAGAPPIEEVLDWAVDHRAAGILIDTAVKDAAGLFDHTDAAELERFIARARCCSVLIALAGSLAGSSLQRAIALGPDIVALRGAACSNGDRRQSIQTRRVRQLVQLTERSCTAADPCAG